MGNRNKKQTRNNSRNYLEAKEAVAFASKNSGILDKVNEKLGPIGRSNRSKAGWESCTNIEERLCKLNTISAEKSILKGIERRKLNSVNENLTTRTTNKILHCDKDGIIINTYENANTAAIKIVNYSRSFIYRSIKYGHKMYDQTYFIKQNLTGGK